MKAVRHMITVTASSIAADFTVPSQPLAFGETLKIVGSTPELGDWDVEGALALEWGEGNNWSGSTTLPPGPAKFKVVIIRGDGSAWWEEGPNRSAKIPEDGQLTITCRLGDSASTEVTAGGSRAEAASAAAEDEGAHSAANTPVHAAGETLDAELSSQAHGGAEGFEPPELDTASSAQAEAAQEPLAAASAVAALEDETAELAEEKIGGQQPVPQQPAQPNTPPAPSSDGVENLAGVSGGATAAQPVQGAELNNGSPALAKGDGQFLGRGDVVVGEDGSITFSLDPADDSVQQLAQDILQRLQG